MKFLIDLHVHSCFSYDSFMQPQKLISIAKSKGLSGVAIVDHGTIKGSLETKKSNNDNNFIVITGAEYHTRFGDILGLFLKEEIITKDPYYLLEEIKKQGGISILAHPCRTYLFPRFGTGKKKKIPEDFLRQVDLIEGYNLQTRTRQNKEAVELAKKYNKKIVSGSDAHFYYEIGKGAISLEVEELKEEAIKKALLEGEFSVTYKNFFSSFPVGYLGTFFIRKYKKLFWET